MERMKIEEFSNLEPGESPPREEFNVEEPLYEEARTPSGEKENNRGANWRENCRDMEQY